MTGRTGLAAIITGEARSSQTHPTRREQAFAREGPVCLSHEGKGVTKWNRGNGLDDGGTLTLRRPGTSRLAAAAREHRAGSTGSGGESWEAYSGGNARTGRLGRSRVSPSTPVRDNRLGVSNLQPYVS